MRTASGTQAPLVASYVLAKRIARTLSASLLRTDALDAENGSPDIRARAADLANTIDPTDHVVAVPTEAEWELVMHLVRQFRGEDQA